MADRTKTAGWLLIACGVVGVLTGGSIGGSLGDFAAHGVEGMGLTRPWAALSSADGTFLGALLILAGVGWLRRKPWAPLITLLYGIHGMTITGLDLIIFWTQAEPGPMRNKMLVLDGIAFAVAATTFVLLARWWLRRPRFDSAGAPG